MFASAFKSFSSNIYSSYEISKQPTTTSGVWVVFDAKKKSTGTAVSIFTFDRKALEVSSNGFGSSRTSSTSIRKAQDEVVERLKREASSLARLRHPSILQLVEPVEDTRSGGLIFATEPILSSLSSALEQKDLNSSRSNSRSRSPSGVESRTGNQTKDIELDELEIQKGLLQVAKGLEFLHDSAKLVHGNLTPDGIWINAKSDWKISGLAFAGPSEGGEGNQTLLPISLSEALFHDPRVPRTVQLNLDYTSPDFVLDSNVTYSADIFSLGLVLLACYREPHRSPVETHGNQSTYKKIFSSAASAPSSSNNFLCAGRLPRELEDTLPRVLTRRPAQRLTAAEFQQSSYFDNVLVNTMRFLDSLPAKTPAEKSQFMRGLSRVMAQFPASILSKKVLVALLEEMKDKELLALILQNIFQIIKLIPSGREVVSEKILPRIRETFLVKNPAQERDTSREAGLVVVLENIHQIAENCSAQQFKEDMLPVLQIALESSTHTLTDAALSTIPSILPMIDFSTVKHDLFPIVANVFSKTSSLSIKVRGLEAIGFLCGASTAPEKRHDDFSARAQDDETTSKNMSSLDKFTMQEKVVPLLKVIKTKEPAVMMAALKVFRQVGQVADVDFLATEIMPILWSFALGPLLDLRQFQGYMELIKALSNKIEKEQVRKLQELSTSRIPDSRAQSGYGSSYTNGTQRIIGVENTEPDFEKLVLNKKEDGRDPFSGALSDGQKLTQNPPTFSWTSVNTTNAIHSNAPRNATPVSHSMLQPQPVSRSVTPDVVNSAFTASHSGLPASNTWGTNAASQQPAITNSNVWNSNTSSDSAFQSFTQPAQSGQMMQSSQTLPSRPAFSNIAGNSAFNLPNSTASAGMWQSQNQTPVTTPVGGVQRTMSSGWTPMLAPPPSTSASNQAWQKPITPQPVNNQNAYTLPIGFLQPSSSNSFQQSQSLRPAPNQNEDSLL